MFQTAFHRIFQLLSQTAHVRSHSRKWVHTRLCQQDRTQGLTRRNRGRFRWGVVSLPSERSTRFGNPAWPGIRTANFAAFGPWSGVLSKNTESFGTAMRLCVSLSRRRRGPAGLRCPVAAARSARFSGIERLDQAFRQSYYHTQQPNGQLFGTCVGTALGGKMRAITLGFKESYHGWTLPYKRTDPRVFHGTFRAERSQATVEKYLRSVRGFSLFLDGRPVTKSVILEWKGFLRRRGYAPSTVNASLAALNYLFNFLGWSDCRTHYLKIQRRLFRETGRELDRADYRPLSSLFMFISSLQHKDIPRS